MSPYMRAYEAGIKLAQLEWMSKVATPPQEGAEAPSEDPANVDEYSQAELAAMEAEEAAGDASQAPAAAPTQAQGAGRVEMREPTTEEGPPPEYFTARGGYGTMARNLRDYYQNKMDNLYDNTELSDEDFDSQMARYEDRMDQIGDVTGRELSQIYGNQMFQAGDQLNMDDMLDRLQALRDKETDYTYGGVDVQRGGRSVNLTGRQQAPRGGSRAVAQAPTQVAEQDDYNFTDADFEQAPAAPAQKETAQQLLARIQANPGRIYENVVGPTLDARSAPTATYQAPSGRGDLGGMVSGTGMQVQGGRTGVQDRRAVADNAARLQGLRRSIASGSPGQGARFSQLEQVMRDSGRGSVNLTSPSGQNFNLSQGDVANQAQTFSPNLARPAVAAKSMGAPTPAPQFNPSQGMMGNVMAQNRQVKSPPTQRMPSYQRFPSQQGATPTAVASKKPEYNPLAGLTPPKDQSYALRGLGLK